MKKDRERLGQRLTWDQLNGLIATLQNNEDEVLVPVKKGLDKEWKRRAVDHSKGVAVRFWQKKCSSMDRRTAEKMVFGK